MKKEKEINDFIDKVFLVLKAGNSDLAVKTFLKLELEYLYDSAFIAGQEDVL